MVRVLFGTVLTTNEQPSEVELVSPEARETPVLLIFTPRWESAWSNSWSTIVPSQMPRPANKQAAALLTFRIVVLMKPVVGIVHWSVNKEDWSRMLSFRSMSLTYILPYILLPRPDLDAV